MPKRSSNVGLSRDASELNAASILDEIIDESASPQEHDDDFWKTAADLRAGEAIIRIISEILGGGNAALTAECLALATGVAYAGASESAIAKKFGITRAAVSKRCIEICERVGVKNHRAMRTDRACRAYATARVESLERQGMTFDPERPRRERREVFGQIAARLGVAFGKLRPEWLKTASAAELLLCRRSLRPAFQVADELERLIRSKNDPAITRQLDHDHAGKA
jgi:DNA-binding phage protein